MPPKHDLRGGKESADSFAMSSIVLVAPMKCSFVAVKSRKLAICNNRPISYKVPTRSLPHLLFGVVFSEGWTSLRDMKIRFGHAEVLKPRGHNRIATTSDA